jgi:hypothetical protein
MPADYNSSLSTEIGACYTSGYGARLIGGTPGAQNQETDAFWASFPLPGYSVPQRRFEYRLGAGYTGAGARQGR